MNKLIKVFLAIIGAVNTIFSIFLPTLVALLIVILVSLTQFNQQVVLIAGMVSTFYRAISLWIPENKD